jgi:hypothetical protein
LVISFPHHNKPKGDIIRHPALASSGLYSNPIARLTQESVQELAWSPSRDRLKGKKLKKYTLEDYAEVLLLDEVIGFCFQLIKLRATEAFGKYSHNDDTVTEFVKTNFTDMDGTLEEFVGIAVAIAYFFGFFTGEIGWKYNTPGFYRQQRLKCLQPHNPLTTRFKGNKHGLFWVVDRSGDKPIDIPYEKCLHVSNRMYENDPYGYGSGARTIGLFKAKRTILSASAVAANNQAQGLWIVRADTADTVVLTDKNGKALQQDGRDMTASAVENAFNQLRDFDKNNFVILDKKYELNWQPMPVDSGFMQQSLEGIDRRLFMSQNVPYLIANEGSGGFGFTGVAAQQAITLDSQISALVKQVRDQILEKIVKPMLIRNFALKPKQGWGKFDVDKSSDPNQSMAQVNTINGSVAAGTLTLDTTVKNKVRELLGLPPQTEEEQLAALEKAVQAQAMQQQATQQGAKPEEEPPTGNEAAEQNYP